MKRAHHFVLNIMTIQRYFPSHYFVSITYWLLGHVSASLSNAPSTRYQTHLILPPFPLIPPPGKSRRHSSPQTSVQRNLPSHSWCYILCIQTTSAMFLHHSRMLITLYDSDAGHHHLHLIGPPYHPHRTVR